MSYQVDDYILFRQGEIGRLDAIFIHELSLDSRRLFAYVTRVSKHSAPEDIVLGIPMLRRTKERIMIGLPAIAARKLYIVSVEHSKDGELRLGGSDMLLYCNWTDIQFL